MNRTINRKNQRKTKTTDKPSKPKNLLSAQNIFYAGVGWSVIALLFFLLFSIEGPDQETPFWYSIGTYVIELGAFLGAGLLCYRNWRSPQIASGRSVWLGIGLGMFFFFVGSCVYGIWELYFKLEPDVSPADLFYMAFYISLGWGMVLAVLPRRLNLEWRQWWIVGAIAAIGIILALLIILAKPSDGNENQVNTNAATEQVAPSPKPAPSPKASPKPAPAQKTASKPAPAQKTASKPAPAPKKPPLPPQVKTQELTEIEHPKWLVAMDEVLSQYSDLVNSIYTIADVILLIVATTLLLAFWGGRFSQSWRMIAAATFALYIADMWSKYAYKFIPNYESGNLLEVFFVFSGVLFGLGAALEYDVSTSRHGRSRRKKG